MIRVRVEFVPFGDEKLAHEVCKLKVWNDGTGTSQRGNYQYEAIGEKAYVGAVDDFNRSLGLLRLLYEVLDSMLRSEGK